MELLERTLRNGLLANLAPQNNVSQKNIKVAALGASFASQSPTKSLLILGSPTKGGMKSPAVMGDMTVRTLPLSPTVAHGGPPIEIPLRDPIDIECKLNHKLAK